MQAKGNGVYICLYVFFFAPLCLSLHSASASVYVPVIFMFIITSLFTCPFLFRLNCFFSLSLSVCATIWYADMEHNRQSWTYDNDNEQQAIEQHVYILHNIIYTHT